MATLYHPDGTAVEIQPADPRSGFTLEEMQALVGGYIHIVTSSDGRHAVVVNEEGKLIGLPYNRRATQLALTLTDLAPSDSIVGSMLVCSPLEAGFGRDT